MMKLRAMNPLAVACSVALASPLAARAEPVLEEIIVTAQKRAESILDIPISIKVLEAATLETVNADSLDDIARLVPSMSMAETGGRGRSNVQIRGLGSNVGSVGTTAIYNDGVIAASRIASSGTFTEQDSVLFDVERVEVLRGPQGTLYGEGSFGGVINIISNRPDPSGFDAGLSGSWFDIEGGGSGSTDINGMLNVPLIKDTLAMRVVGFRNDHQGYIDGYDALPTYLAAVYGLNPADYPPAPVGKNLDTELVTGGRFSIRYTSGPVDANLILKRQKTEIGLASLETDYLNLLKDYAKHGRDTSAVFIGSDPLLNSFAGESTTDEGVLELNVQTSRGTWTSITGYGQIDVKTLGNSTSDNTATSQELRFSTDSKGAINWTVGAYYRTAEITEDFEATPLNNEKVDQWSVFGQMYWDIMPAVRATLGLRYGEQTTEVTDLLNEAALGALAHSKATFDDLSPKLAMDWRVNANTLLYASIAKGFRGGGANVDASLGEDPNFTRDFKPDSIWNYEIGAKAAILDNKVALNAAVFYIDWSDIQIDRPIQDNVTGNPEGVFIVTNGDKAHSYGFETDVYLYPAEGWEIFLGGSLMNPRYDSGTIDSPYEGGRTFDLKGEHLPSAPEYTFNTSVSKTFPIGSSGMNGLVRADYSLRGDSYSDVPNKPLGTHLNSGSMEVINLRAGIQADKWEIQAFVLNLADSNDSSFNYDTGSFLFRSRLQPRTVGLNVKLNLR